MKSPAVPMALLCGALTACAGAERSGAASPQVPPAPATSDNGAGKTPNRSVINISEDIRRACGISDADAHFAFDSARVNTADYPVLDKLARCFASGPLAGRRMQLVGHADPRGSDEYNLVLGNSRADGVKEVLLGRGLSSGQVATTSRGEMDAKGKDESSWAEDRRVDILLAN